MRRPSGAWTVWLTRSLILGACVYALGLFGAEYARHPADLFDPVKTPITRLGSGLLLLMMCVYLVRAIVREQWNNAPRSPTAAPARPVQSTAGSKVAQAFKRHPIASGVLAFVAMFTPVLIRMAMHPHEEVFSALNGKLLALGAFLAASGVVLAERTGGH